MYVCVCGIALCMRVYRGGMVVAMCMCMHGVYVCGIERSMYMINDIIKAIVASSSRV